MGSETVYEYKRVLAQHSLEAGDDNQSPEEILALYGPQGWRLAAAYRVPGGEILYLERTRSAVPDPVRLARAEAAERLLALALRARMRSISHGPLSPEGRLYEICLGWGQSGDCQAAIGTIIGAAVAESGADGRED